MQKNMGFWGIFSLSAGAMISSGIFVLPGLAFANAGPGVFISYFIAGCIALTTVFSLSELVTAMPKAGGDYFYVSRTFGKLFGTVSGLLSWVALSLKSAFAIIGIAELTHLAFGLNLTFSAIMLAIVFTFINLAGAREAVRFQIGLVAGLLAILLIFSITGLGNISASRYTPFLPQGLNSLFSTAGFVFVSFGGVLTTASIAGEIRNPARNIPLGFIGSTVVVTLLYSLVTFVVVGVTPAGQLQQSLAPVAAAAESIGGFALYAAVIVASLLAFITTANGGILTASRYPAALADDQIMPKLLGKLNRKTGAPYAAITATGLLIVLSVLLNIDTLIKAASAVILLTNIFAHLSVIVMRESKVHNYMPTFRTPLYPWLQIFGIIVFSFLMINMGIKPVVLSLLFVLAGVILYFLRRGAAELAAPALMHLVERITNKKLGTQRLADELRAIIRDREGIVTDEFDQVIESAPFLDIEEPLEFDAFVDRIGAAAHNALTSIQASEIVALLKEREAESSTAISDFVAVPHIIVEKGSAFAAVLVRAKSGVRFSEELPGIKAVFVLMGTRDRRNLHLRALAAIAQTAQQAQFEKKWLEARNETAIKDLFLLSARRRQGRGR